MDLTYGVSAFERHRGNFPTLPVINMFAEETPVENKVSLQSRAGLENSPINMGDGPVSQLFKIDGVLDGSLFGVSGNLLYSNNTSIGGINGSEYTSMAGYANFVFANSGAGIWGYDGTTLAEIDFPDSADVIKICVGASRLIAIRKDTQTFYWSNPLTNTVDPLSFASAENTPDRLKDALFIGNTLILFGSETVEFWPVSDDTNLPFQPLQGRVFQVGVKATGCAVEIGSTFVWVTDNNQVCLTTPDQVISTPSVEADIATSSSVILWTFVFEGVPFLAIRTDTNTHILSSRSRQWARYTSFGENNWVAQCYAEGYFGSSIDGNTLNWSDDYSDFDYLLERRLGAWLPIDSVGVTASNITLRTTPGQTDALMGTYANPVVSLRTSKDGGFTWGNWKSRRLGSQGEYRQFTQWLSMGMFSYPGLLIEIRVTDPVPFRVSGLTINDPYGGI